VWSEKRLVRVRGLPSPATPTPRPLCPRAACPNSGAGMGGGGDIDEQCGGRDVADLGRARPANPVFPSFIDG